MDLEHSFTVPVDVDTAWAEFQDIGSIAECFPGAQVTGVEGDSFNGSVKVKLGPISLVYNGSGTFVDFGCGDGTLLLRARDLGWRPVGVELDETVAARAAARTGLPVTADLASVGDESVDALHLGDVLEHLTDLDRELPRLLRLLKRGGYLIA